ncbi:MAG TPA: hypothetical protein VII73_01630 [Caulobacteraceae bacterium]
MTTRYLTALAAFALIASVTAASAAPSSPAKTSSADDPDKMICKTVVPTGSRLGGVRTCQTRAQWAVLTRDSQDALHERQKNGYISH